LSVFSAGFFSAGFAAVSVDVPLVDGVDEEDEEEDDESPDAGLLESPVEDFRA
jgi:hypothetical protein